MKKIIPLFSLISTAVLFQANAETSTNNTFTLRRAFREIFSPQTVQDAANSFFRSDLKSGYRKPLPSEKFNEELQQAIGPANAPGIESLLRRNYPEARKQAYIVLTSTQGEDQRVAAWVLVLAEQQLIPETEMTPTYEKLIALDPNIHSIPEARSQAVQAQQKLDTLRKDFLNVNR